MIELNEISKFLVSEMDLQIDCKEVGFVHSKKQDILSYISDLRYLEVAEQNRNIRALLWDSSLGEPPSNSRLEFIPVVQSKLAFLFLQNSFKRLNLLPQ